MPRRFAACVALALAVGACGGQKPRIVVAAASDLTYALGELGAAFQAKTGIEVAPTFGASKLLATQINQGAPFDLFMSADVKQIDAVIAEGGCDAGSKALYGRGHLVIWTRDGGVKEPSRWPSSPTRASVASPSPTPTPRPTARRPRPRSRRPACGQSSRRAS
ncbi:MAG: molybdate ABC transporter substrate-binding protein [Myxococcota bacterium]